MKVGNNKVTLRQRYGIQSKYSWKITKWQQVKNAGRINKEQVINAGAEIAFTVFFLCISDLFYYLH